MPREQGKSRSAVRRAEKRAEAAAWQAKVDQHFAYLRTDYGFTKTRADTFSVWTISAYYQSDRAAVEVVRNVEFGRAELELIRLVNGKMPQYPDIASNTTVFDFVLEIRSPQLLTQLWALTGLDDEHVEASLVFLAKTLVEIAPDFLAGELAIFEAVEEGVKQSVDEIAKQRAEAEKQWLEAKRQTTGDGTPT
jgi:hypothetical protein